MTVKSFDNRHLAITLLNNSYEMILINFVITWDKNILTKHVISESCKDLAWQVGKNDALVTISRNLSSCKKPWRNLRFIGSAHVIAM